MLWRIFTFRYRLKFKILIMNYLGFSKEKVENTVKQLNQLLANYQIYYQNLRNFHWNVKGEDFFELHVEFEGLYNEAKVTIDEIAERILTLRLKPVSLLSKYLELSQIEEANVGNSRDMVSTILSNHKILITNMRAILETASESNDEGTIDLIAGFLSTIEKKSWMLDAWLQK